MVPKVRCIVYFCVKYFVFLLNLLHKFSLDNKRLNDILVNCNFNNDEKYNLIDKQINTIIKKTLQEMKIIR